MISILLSILFSNYTTLEPKPFVRCSSLRKTTFEVDSIQLSKIINRPFPSSPFSPESQKFLNKYKFHFSDVTDDEYLKLS